MKREIRQTTRERYLTPEEAAKYRLIRELVEQEKPEIKARIRTSPHFSPRGRVLCSGFVVGVMKPLGDADGVTEGLILQSAKRLTVGFWLWAQSFAARVRRGTELRGREVRQAGAGRSQRRRLAKTCWNSC